jgi:hypothetical protein
VENIKIDLREIGWGGMKWVDLAQDRDQCKALLKNGDEPAGSLNCWEVLE